jgi:hypothetical protein
MGSSAMNTKELKSFMSMHWPSICITTLAGPQEHALIMKERSARYKAAQPAGTLPD